MIEATKAGFWGRSYLITVHGRPAGEWNPALAVTALWMAVPLAAWPLAWVIPYLPVFLLAGYALRAVASRPPPPVDQGVVHHQTRQTSVRFSLIDGERGDVSGADLRARFWRFTGPRAVASVLQLALQRLDILLIAAIAGPAPAAIYTVAGRFGVLGQLINQAIGYPVQPRLAERLGGLAAGCFGILPAIARAVT
jgi:hypothetical protein